MGNKLKLHFLQKVHFICHLTIAILWKLLYNKIAGNLSFFL